MSIVGLILKASYQLSRHRIGPLRLNLVPLVLALASGLIWRVGSLTGEQAVLIIVICLILVLVTLLAKRQGFIIFRRQGETSSPGVARLAPDEKVAVRATGLFEVQGERRYFVEASAGFATMETREHAVMVRMLSSRFLVGAPKDDVGWWYIFFKPHKITGIEVGQIHFGLNARPAIKLGYKADEGKGELVYLSFDNPLQMQRVSADLRRDAKLKSESVNKAV